VEEGKKKTISVYSLERRDFRPIEINELRGKKPDGSGKEVFFIFKSFERGELSPSDRSSIGKVRGGLVY